MHKHLTRDKREFIIRQPEENDAANIIAYSKILFASTDQTLTTLEEYTITIDAEKTWINNMNQNASSLLLIAEVGSEIAGLLFFIPQPKKKHAHSGEFGVSVHPKHQALGIGRALIERLIIWAKGNEQIAKVFLQVFATNTHAIRLYRDLGFIQEALLIKAIKQASGEFVDVIQMYMETK